MIATREQQKARALELMPKLGLPEGYIKAFEKDSDYVGAYFSELWKNPLVKTLIKNLEQFNGIFVYYVTHEDFPWGECYTFLCVSKYVEDLKITDVKDYPNDGKIAWAWVENIDRPYMSEYGSVALKNKDGFLVRVG